MAVLDRLTERLQRLLGSGPGRAQADAPGATGPEMAWGGSRISAGIVADEHNQDLVGLAGIRTAAKMRRSDAQVRAVHTVISLPIRSTSWLIEEPDNPSQAEREAADLLRDNLFGGMEHSFDDLLREATLAIYYGFRVPEIVWDEQGGLIRIRKVAGRNPELVERWLYDESGRLVGYLYAGNRPVGAGLRDTVGAVARYERVAVPLEKTVHLVYDRENESPAGFGLWRSMYAPWYIKQALLKIMAIGIERNLLDVPVGRLPRGAQVDDRERFLTILRRWRAAEDAAVVLADGQELEFVGSQRSLLDGMPFLHYQDFKIASAGLATFLQLGQQSVGTQALGEELSKIFLLAEEANARWIEQTLNTQLLRRWCLLNYGEGVRCPVLRHRRIERELPLAQWAEGLQKLAAQGLLQATVDDEEYIRDVLELPAIPREQLQAMRSAPGPQPARPGQAVQARETIEARRFADPDIAAQRAARARQEDEFAEQAAARLETIQAAYLERLRTIVEEIESADPIAQGKPIAKLAETPVPGAREYEEWVRRFLWQVFHQGRETLARELGEDLAGRPIPNRIRQWVAARAAVIAADHIAQLRSAVLERVLTGVRAEMPARRIFSDAGAEAIDRLQRRIQEDWHQAAAEIVAMVNDEVG